MLFSCHEPDALPGMEVDTDMDDGFPQLGEVDDLETALEELIDAECERVRIVLAIRNT